MSAQGGATIVLAEVLHELTRARERFSPYASAHEGLAVIREEYLELEDAIFHGSGADAYYEALQLAAVAVRYCVDIGTRGRSASA